MHSVGCHLSDIQEAVMEFYKETEKKTWDTNGKLFFQTKNFLPFLGIADSIPVRESQKVI